MFMSRTNRGGTLIVVAAVAVMLAGSPAFAVFTPGDLYYASSQAPGNIYNLAGGGRMTGRAPFAVQGCGSFGQMAWSADLTTMYSTAYSCDTVFSISASGAVSSYASVAGPTGIVRTQDDRLLVVSNVDGWVWDITNPPHRAVVATGMTSPRNIIQLPTGEILVADTGSKKVWDISSGSLVPYASLPGSSYYVVDLDYTSDGRVFATNDKQVYEVTGGTAQLFAWSHAHLMGLAIDRSTDQIFASPFGDHYVLDITTGGYVSSPGHDWAYSIPGSNNAALDFVPYPSVPVPGALLLVVVGFLSVAGSRCGRT
jgi:WD40 repeat protein